MVKQKRYYLGRVHKLGYLDNEMIVRALDKPEIIERRNYRWTFTNTQTKYNENKLQYVYSELSKFDPTGEVSIINEEKRKQDTKAEPNLLIASSPFIYIPEYSGIAYQHVWNQINRETFLRRFREILIRSAEEIMIDCEIEPITDLRKFSNKLTEIDTYLEIKATVHPPNPLFGKAWENLNKYLGKRVVPGMLVYSVPARCRP